ncbi:host cell division inhibitor Icd-like protein [Escherichia coli]
MVNANPCSRPEFIWRFHSLQKHCDHFAIAATEKEARSLIPDQHGVLTGRFSTSPQPNPGIAILPIPALRRHTDGYLHS